MDPIYVSFWARKLEFWRRPRALWCFTGSSFRDHNILGTEKKKTVLGTILEPKMATKIPKKPFRRGFQNGADFGISFKSAGAQLLGRPGGMRRARGRLQRGCRKLVKGQTLERRRLLKGLLTTDFDVR